MSGRGSPQNQMMTATIMNHIIRANTTIGLHSVQSKLIPGYVHFDAITLDNCNTPKTNLFIQVQTILNRRVHISNKMFDPVTRREKNTRATNLLVRTRLNILQWVWQHHHSLQRMLIEKVTWYYWEFSVVKMDYPQLFPFQKWTAPTSGTIQKSRPPPSHPSNPHSQFSAQQAKYVLIFSWTACKSPQW